MTFREQVADWLEEARVRWFLLDSQKKQILLLAGLYIGLALLDIGASIVKARVLPTQGGTS